MPERTRLKIQWNPPVFGCEEFYAARKYFRNPAVPVRVFRAGHAGTVMHAHDFMELALVTSGSARYEFCSAAGVRRGCELLEGTSLSVEEIAEEIGFNTSSLFRHHFRACYRVSPRTWRKNFSNANA